VENAAKKYKVRVRTSPGVEHKIEIKNARGMLKFFREFDQVDVTCLTQKLEYLERKVEFLKQTSAGTAQEEAHARAPECDESQFLISKLRSGEIADSAGILKMIEDVEREGMLSIQKLNEKWIAAAEAALTKNKSTFAMLPASQLKNPTGHLAKLRELGYEVEEPGSVVELPEEGE
jgi:tRNA G26 N,N-dimethylase Trm1